MSSTASKNEIVSFEEARHIVEEHAAKLLEARRESSATETVDLPAARGRVLAEEIVADRDFPPFHRATRDGYAVRAADSEHVPAQLAVIGEIKAGQTSGLITLDRGQAAAIMTGAPLPQGADAVVMVEYTAPIGSLTGSKNSHPNVAKDATSGWGSLEGKIRRGLVEIQRSVKSGENFVPRGAEARAGQVLIEKGRRLDHSLIGIAAAVGKSRVQVFRKPRIAVLATGDEVVEIDAVPGPAQIRNSNTYSLTAQIEEAGGEAVRLPIAPDETGRLRELLEQGLGCDLLLISGGVSAGKYDLVEQVLAEMKAEFYFTGVRMQPGKPAVFGACMCGAGGSTPHYFFGLPGNPVSTMVTFRLFAQPLIAALDGAPPEPLVFLKARLKGAVRTATGLTRFLPAVISGSFENVEVELAAWQGSGDIGALARANCYMVIPPDRERIEAGEWISVVLR